MKPYLIEGLDCSGKKTVAALVEAYFAHTPMPVQATIGPLVHSPLQWLDTVLTQSSKPFPHRHLLDLLRRNVYLAGPVIDGLWFRPTPGATPLKISSHYRAYARAMIEQDRWMVTWFRRLDSWMMTYGGCTYLTTPFATRLDRHRADVRNGITTKQEEIRFFHANEAFFQRWDTTLWELVSTSIPQTQRLETSQRSPQAIADQVIEHMLYCKKVQVIP